MIYIVLIETQLAENLGAVARVMGNFNQNVLRLVRPQISPLDEKASATAVGSKAILENAKCYSTLSEAVGDARAVIGTTATPRQLLKFYHTPRSLCEDMKNIHQPVALVFGPERTGLNNADLAQCSAIVRIPVSPDFTSLNLSHAVGIMLYEIYQTTTDQTAFWHQGKTKQASAQDVDGFLKFLEDHLDQTHFWRTHHKKEGMKNNLVSMFKRQEWFDQDLKTLRGVVDALSKKETD